MEFGLLNADFFTDGGLYSEMRSIMATLPAWQREAIAFSGSGGGISCWAYCGFSACQTC